MFKFAFQLFHHYLLSRRTGSVIRSVAWVSLSGVVVGIAAMVIVLSVMNGFNGSIRNRLLAVEPHLVVSISGVKSAEHVKAFKIYQDTLARKNLRVDLFETQDLVVRTQEGQYGGAQARGLDQKTIRSMRIEIDRAEKARMASRNAPEPKAGLATDDVVSASTSAGGSGEQSGDLRASDVRSNDVASAVDVASGIDVTSAVETAQAKRFQLEPGQILMGIDLAQTLHVYDGDRVTLVPPEGLLLPAGEVPPYETVVVKEVVTTNVPDVDRQGIFYLRGQTLQQVRSLASQEFGFEIRLPNPEKYQDLYAELLSGAKLESKDGVVIRVQTWVERNSSLFFALRLEKFMMSLLLGLAALIASFSMITVLVLLITQKRKDIGMLMAMGLSADRTRQVFMTIGFILSSVGMLGGLTLGLGVCAILYFGKLPIPSDVYFDATIPVRVDPLLIFALIFVASAIAYISSRVPTSRLTSLTPTEALRKTRGN